MTGCFLAIRVRPAGRHITRAAGRSFPACGLLAEWPPQAEEPSGYWLSTLPEDTAIEELVRLAKIRWRVEHDYRELKTGLGLDPSKAARSPAGTAASLSPSCPGLLHPAPV
jgi:SRSO17 transposase